MDNNTLASVQAVINAHQEVELAYVFGSVATGLATINSDLDVAVLTPKRLTAGAKITLVEDFAQATGRAIDLIDLHTVGEPLLGEILRDGIRVKGPNALHAEMLKKHLFDSADFLPYAQRILAERRQKWAR